MKKFLVAIFTQLKILFAIPIQHELKMQRVIVLLKRKKNLTPFGKQYFDSRSGVSKQIKPRMREMRTKSGSI